MAGGVFKANEFRNPFLSQRIWMASLHTQRSASAAPFSLHDVRGLGSCVNSLSGLPGPRGQERPLHGASGDVRALTELPPPSPPYIQEKTVLAWPHPGTFPTPALGAGPHHAAPGRIIEIVPGFHHFRVKCCLTSGLTSSKLGLMGRADHRHHWVKSGFTFLKGIDSNQNTQ